VNPAWAAAVNDYKKLNNLPRVFLSEGRGKVSVMNERRLLMQCESQLGGGCNGMEYSHIYF
jgi:hypothetical protein